jgi:deoxycytidylate deaminase
MKMTKDEKFIEFACQYAYQSEMFSRHGCVLVSQGRIVSYGVNQLRNYSKDRIIQGCSCHAEMDAIRNAVKNKVFVKHVPKLTIYIARFNRNHTYLDARPCILCYHLISSYGIRRIVYTLEGTIVRVNTLDYTPQEHTKGNQFALTISSF